MLTFFDVLGDAKGFRQELFNGFVEADSLLARLFPDKAI